jgi:hypothetical protein
MKRTGTRILLVISGLILVVVGTGVLFLPHGFYESNGTILGSEPSLLSEIRASGGLLFGCGIVVLIAAFRSSIRRQALALSALVFLAYGVARLAGMAIDGMPSTSLIVSTGIELLVGTLCALQLRRPPANTLAREVK